MHTDNGIGSWFCIVLTFQAFRHINDNGQFSFRLGDCTAGVPNDFEEADVKVLPYGKPALNLIQEEILRFWEQERIFEKSVEERTGEEVVFYDGPPFPTGKPHHGTVLVSFIKDMIARYQTMRGYRVPRVWGWDCHGLPIENQAETLLGINDKNEIENGIGIDKFNEKCFEIVSNNNEA